MLLYSKNKLQIANQIPHYTKVKIFGYKMYHLLQFNGILHIKH